LIVSFRKPFLLFPLVLFGFVAGYVELLFSPSPFLFVERRRVIDASFLLLISFSPPGREGDVCAIFFSWIEFMMFLVSPPFPIFFALP